MIKSDSDTKKINRLSDDLIDVEMSIKFNLH